MSDGFAPVVHVISRGNLGNRMIQFMAALAISDTVPGCLLSNIELPEWGIRIPELPVEGARLFHREFQDGDVGSLAAVLREGKVSVVEFDSYAQRVENFLPRARYAETFRSDQQDHLVTDETDLVINIRGGEVLDGRHTDYVLIPIDFYAYLIYVTGLRPLFMGQIEDNPYCDALRERFPTARFEPSRGAIADFQTMRHATHIVPAVSTFSWLAAWLSPARQIFLPLIGLFHPTQSRFHDFCPPDDPRYRFYWFPATFNSGVADFAHNHAALGNAWKPVAFHDVVQLRYRQLGRPRRKDAYVRLFDEQFYLSYHGFVREQLYGYRSPLAHYVSEGYYANLEVFALDRAWYARTYPQAAWELGQGEFIDLHHHYVSVGHARGYRPVPP